MSSWKKYFSAVPTQARLSQQLERKYTGDATTAGSSSKFSSYLPEVYSGAPNRIERYIQYEQMDLDSEISKALDTISDFGTQGFEINDEPFTFGFKGKLTETEITLLKESLSQWCSLNKWQQRLWRMFRNCIKYGDQIFVRDPETFKLIWIDPTKVEKIIVNESKGKEIEQYVIRDLDFNLQTLVGTNLLVHDQYSFPGGYPRSSNPAAGAGTVNYGQASTPGSRNSRFDNMPNQTAVNAEHVIHLSLSEGLDNQWPFGTSILESIYKVYKQKDLLEDAILIYRIVRAPERRVFYIDVGSLSGPRAMQHVERIKNEIYQRRIPNRCLALDTKIPLLDGRTLELREIITEYNNGVQLWAYSCDPVTGEVVPGKITWAGETRKQAQVVRITLDNGKTITCTPDHKFPIRGKGFVEAQNLEIGESFIPAYFRRADAASNKESKNGYTQIFDNKSKEWKFVHKLVADYVNAPVDVYNENYSYKNKNTIHHIDFNRYNNNPDNLCYIVNKDHSEMTSTIYNDLIARANRLRHRIVNYNKTLFGMMKNIVINSNNPTLSLKVAAEISNNDHSFMKYYADSNREHLHQDNFLVFTIDKLKSLVKANDFKTWSEFNTANPTVKKRKFGPELFMSMLQNFGYKNCNDFVSKIDNHKRSVVSIEWLSEPVDTGTLTIDGNEELHNYHTFALDVGVFTKNSGGGSSVIDAAYNPISINEDYFLATNAEGKGTRIDTLNGGDNLGQIDDLKYFNNKMIRGLGVPSSYLPTGADDGTTAYNDGKVGTAYVQEYRFSKYCQRLQNQFAPTLDKEFKLFIKNRGIEIDSSLFELQFYPPQSFSQFRQMQMDGEQVNLFSSLMSTEASRYVSKRFALQRYLGWNDDDIIKNEQMWKEENTKKIKDKTGVQTQSGGEPAGLGNLGIRPESGLGDLGLPEEGLPGEELGAETPETAPPGPGSAAPVPGAPAEPGGAV